MSSPYDYIIPPIQRIHLCHDALGYFLHSLKFEVGEPRVSGGERKTLEIGSNLFLDTLPKFLYSQDVSGTLDPSKDVVVVLNNETAISPGRGDRFNQKVTGAVRFNVFSGDTTLAKRDAVRLYRFFLQRRVQFSTSSVRVLQIDVQTEPSLVGVETTHWSQYEFRALVLLVVKDNLTTEGS